MDCTKLVVTEDKLPTVLDVCACVCCGGKLRKRWRGPGEYGAFVHFACVVTRCVYNDCNLTCKERESKSCNCTQIGV